MVIIETKLHIPTTRHEIISRPSLLAKLDEGLTYKVTLVTAPPGYGKTTALCEWTRQADVPVAWISLDQGDNEWIRFWMHLLAALKKEVASFDEQHVYRVVSLGDTEESFIAALINVLNRLKEPVVIVWDDFHVIEHASILRGITYFLKWLPEHVHVYIISRVRPSQVLSVPNLQAKGELHAIGVEDLRFTYDEANHHMDHLVGRCLSVEEKTSIVKRTEGWMTGMHLACLWLNGENRYATTIDDISGTQRDISDYFFAEVLDNQSEVMCTFLLKTSILERLNGRLCEAITGFANGSEMLHELERQNLFIVPLDGHREWYRYHHLFHEFLAKKYDILIREKGNVAKCHLAAGKWLEEHRFLEEATTQYAVGGYHNEVLRLLDHLLPSLADYERASLHKWLNEIPNEKLFEKPMLYLTNLTALFLFGNIHAAQDKFWWAIHRLENEEAVVQLSPHQMEIFRAGLLFLAAFKTYLERNVELSIRYSKQYIELDPTGSIFVSLGTSGGGHHAMWEIHVMTSSLQTSDRVLQELLDIWSRTENAYFYAHLCIDYGRLLYERNRLEEAEHYLLQTSGVGKAYGNVSLEVMAAILLARVYTAQGRLSMANNLIQSLAEQIEFERYPKLAWKLERYRMFMKWSQGGKEQVHIWLADSGLRADDVISPSMIEDYEFMARLLADQSQVEEALSLVERLLRIARRENRQSDLVRLLTLESVLLAKQDKIALSMPILEESLSLGESVDFIRTFLDEGEPLLHLLDRYVQWRQSQKHTQTINVSLSYVKRLIGLYPIQLTKAKHSRLLTAKETEVLQLIDKGLSNKEIADMLGISLSTVKTHVNNMYRKLKVNSRVLAVQRARQLNLFDEHNPL